MSKKKQLNNDDAPELTPALMRQSLSLEEAIPELYTALKRERGRPKAASPKVNATLRLDQDVLAAFKATGKGWQTQINALLRSHMPAT